MEPQNWWFVNVSSFPRGYFQVPCLFSGVYLFKWWMFHCRIQSICAQRKTFQGLQFAHPEFTVCTMARREPDAQAFIRTALNGTFYTSDKLKHQGRCNGDCKFCGSPDSATHRNWECEHFATCRSHLSAEQIECIINLPMCTVNHGWVPEPPALEKFQALCINQEDKSQAFTFPPELPSHLWLFTDGACRAPTSRIARLASWGVVVGNLETMQLWPVASGGVPGVCQTILRAELTAAISACLFAIQCNRQCSLCLDNDLVYRRVRRYHGKSAGLSRIKGTLICGKHCIWQWDVWATTWMWSSRYAAINRATKLLMTWNSGVFRAMQQQIQLQGLHWSIILSSFNSGNVCKHRLRPYKFCGRWYIQQLSRLDDKRFWVALGKTNLTRFMNREWRRQMYTRLLRWILKCHQHCDGSLKGSRNLSAGGIVWWTQHRTFNWCRGFNWPFSSNENWMSTFITAAVPNDGTWLQEKANTIWWNGRTVFHELSKVCIPSNKVLTKFYTFDQRRVQFLSGRNVWRLESCLTFCSSQTNCSWKVRTFIDQCEHCALSISLVILEAKGLR